MATTPTPLAKRIRGEANKRLQFDSNTTAAAKLSACKDFLKDETAFLKEQHRDGASGLYIVRGRTAIIDCLLAAIAKPAFEEVKKELPETDVQIAILALGGYGRKELCPLSDVDIMFLYPSKAKEKELQVIQEIMAQKILYPLWDTGLKVGHSSRTIDEVFKEARADIQNKTAMLEARIVTGSQPLFDSFHNSYYLFYRKEDPKAYIEQRLRDQRDRRAKFGDSVFMQEPDIKSGVGGLRDYHNTFWMARVRLNAQDMDALADLNYLRKDELKAFKDAYDFLLRVRNELHFRSKRPTDLLALESQPKVAYRLGYKQRDILKRVEEFMRDYYSHAQIIYQTSKIIENRLSLTNMRKRDKAMASVKDFLLARRKERVKRVDGFIVRGTEITCENKKIFEEDPVRMIRVFRHMQQHNVELDFELSALIRASLSLVDEKVIDSPEANLSFRTILQETGNVYQTLNLMHELGVLGAFIPEWGQLTCLVQHEYYHRYTADVHTLHTIRELDNIFTDPNPVFSTYRRELHKLTTPNLLYLILFLHDIGKAKAIKNHAENGVAAAEPILDRLEIPEEKRVPVRFIIRNHLEMARFWQRHDLDDPETARAFAEQVESTDQLRLLFVHTFCDARGTAKGLWNNYKDALHTTLFKRTLSSLRDSGKLEEEFRRHKEMTQKELLKIEIPDVSQEEINAHFQLLPDRYFVNTSQSEIILHIKLINELLREIASAANVGTLKPIIDWKQDLNRGFTVVNVITWDRAGLFHKLAGALNIAGYTILSSKAISRDDHIAIDTFYVTESARGNSNTEEAKKLFEECIEEALVSNQDLYPRIQSIMKKMDESLFHREDNPLAQSFQPKIDVYHELSLKRTILEVQAPDHLGLLYQISQCIYKHGFDITFARINTERGIAIDTIYLSSADPNNETDGAKLMALRDALSETLIFEPHKKASA
ncbi:MAG: [protein-PII] uridylyltransferase [Verrucomicrobiota bacterium]